MISIVTGTLNRCYLLENLIKNTVDSNDKLELILVDGGSSDGTLEYIKNLNHPRIKLIEVGERSSYPHFMNLGIKNSTYDLICQWNDDVLLYNDWEEVFKEIDNKYDFYLFNWKYGNIEDLNNEDWLYGIDQTHGWCLSDDSKKGGEIIVNYGIYSKKIFSSIGMYNTEYKFYYADGDMSYRAHKFDFSNKNLRNVKVCSLLTSKKAIHYSDDEEIYRKNLNLYNQKILPNTIEIL
jgi:glycosyltransferase involved in cell wall biosynthesis